MHGRFGMGAKVLLIEKGAYPGGMNTSAMVCPLMTFHSGSKQIVKGIAQEVIDRLAEKGATLGHIPDPLGVTSTITPIEPSILRPTLLFCFTAFCAVQMWKTERSPG